jgi:flagellar biogenesis protein FliO
MWSARMIGVALAFLVPWVLAIIGVGWVVRRVSRARRARKQQAEERGGLS